MPISEGKKLRLTELKALAPSLMSYWQNQDLSSGLPGSLALGKGHLCGNNLSPHGEGRRMEREGEVSRKPKESPDSSQRGSSLETLEHNSLLGFQGAPDVWMFQRAKSRDTLVALEPCWPGLRLTINWRQPHYSQDQDSVLMGCTGKPIHR